MHVYDRLAEKFKAKQATLESERQTLQAALDKVSQALADLEEAAAHSGEAPADQQALERERDNLQKEQCRLQIKRDVLDAKMLGYEVAMQKVTQWDYTAIPGQPSSQRIAAKIEQYIEGLETITAKQSEIQWDSSELETTIDMLETRLQQAAETLTPQEQARMEGKLGQLLAKRERLLLKLELLESKRERLQASLDRIQGRQERAASSARQSYAGKSRPTQAEQTKAQEQAQQYEAERLKVLELLQAGKISVEDASRLLNALEQRGQTATSHGHAPRWVRIVVTDTHTDQVRVNMTLPIGLVKAGLRAGGRIAGVEGVDTISLMELLNSGQPAHLVDVNDEHDGRQMEIFIE